MKPDAINELINRARDVEPRDPGAGDIAVPYGFATRVVTLARQQGGAASWMAWLERRAGRTLSFAGALAALSVMVNLSAINESIEQNVWAADDPVTVVWDLS